MATLVSRITDLALAIRDRLNLVTPRLLPAGGASGQVLAKTSGVDYAAAWADAASGGGGSAPDVSAWPVLVVHSDGASATVNDFATASMPNVDIDTSEGWNTSASTYTIPETGIYQMVFKVRLADHTPLISHGIGIDTANQDSPSFRWQNTQYGGNGERNGHLNIRAAVQCQVGDLFRGFYYIQSGDPVNLSFCELTILRIR